MLRSSQMVQFMPFIRLKAAERAISGETAGQVRCWRPFSERSDEVGSRFSAITRAAVTIATAGLRSGLVVIARMLLSYVFHIGICSFSAILCSCENLGSVRGVALQISGAAAGLGKGASNSATAPSERMASPTSGFLRSRFRSEAFIQCRGRALRRDAETAPRAAKRRPGP